MQPVSFHSDFHKTYSLLVVRLQLLYIMHADLHWVFVIFHKNNNTTLFELQQSRYFAEGGKASTCSTVHICIVKHFT